MFPQALCTRSKDWRLFRLCSPLLVFVSQLSDLHWIQLIFNYPLGFASCKSQKLYEKYKNRCLTTRFSQWPRISCATFFITFIGQYWHIFPSRITLKSLQRFVHLYTVCICHMTQSPMFIILAIVFVHLGIGVIIRARRPYHRISLLPPKKESKADVQVGHIVRSLLLMKSNYFQHEPRPWPVDIVVFWERIVDLVWLFFFALHYTKHLPILLSAAVVVSMICVRSPIFSYLSQLIPYSG